MGSWCILKTSIANISRLVTIRSLSFSDPEMNAEFNRLHKPLSCAKDFHFSINRFYKTEMSLKWLLVLKCHFLSKCQVSLHSLDECSIT